MRVRQGNDFIFLWAIERNGEPEDFSNAVNIRLHFKNFDCVGEVKSFQIVDGNIVRVEVSPEWASNLGAYRLILSYEFEDESYSDGDQKCVVDVLAFNIVPKTSEADDVSEMAKTTDIMIGLNGLSAYEVWLKDNPESTKEDYYNWLQKPATDAVSLIDDKIEHLDEIIDSSTENESERVEAENIRIANETGRVNAEIQRVDNENERLANEINREQAENLRAIAEGSRVDAENIRVSNENARKSNETGRVNAENDRVDAENIRASNESTRLSNEVDRVNAESDRVIAEGLRQANTATAISNAENATLNANTAAQNADNARLAIQDDLALKANHGYASSEVAKTLKQVEDDTSVKMTNLIVNGGFESGVPSWYRGGVQPILSEEEKLSGDSSGYANVVDKVSYSAIDIVCGLNDKLYISVSRRFKSIEGTPTDGIRVNDFGTAENNLILAPFYNGNLDVWETSTFIVNGRANGIRLRIGFFGAVKVEFFVDNFIAVNLTETFGKGSEPTKEEFELLLDILGTDFFEGEITIPAQKIMQWQLKLIRKNKNAIIALGGTII
jgi:hypothetical protein